jgi:hypothetical protein
MEWIPSLEQWVGEFSPWGQFFGERYPVVHRNSDQKSGWHLLLAPALLLMPAGFLLGGIWAQGGDPGLGAVLIPAGALALVLGVSVVAIGVRNGA